MNKFRISLFLAALLALVPCVLSAAGPGPAAGWLLKIERIVKSDGRPSGGCFAQQNVFYLAKGCLSDYQVGDKRYTFRQLTEVTRDSIRIALPDDDQRNSIAPADIRSISTLVYCNLSGVYGWGNVVFNSQDYTFTIVKGNDQPLFQTILLCLDEECKVLYKGYMYHGLSGFTRIFKKDGAYFSYGSDDEEPIPVQVSK